MWVLLDLCLCCCLYWMYLTDLGTQGWASARSFHSHVTCRLKSQSLASRYTLSYSAILVSRLAPSKHSCCKAQLALPSKDTLVQQARKYSSIYITASLL
jgi:hypothetical protein